MFFPLYINHTIPTVGIPNELDDEFGFYEVQEREGHKAHSAAALATRAHARVCLSMSRRPPGTPGNAGCNQHPRATLGWHRGALEPSDGLVQPHSPTLSPAHAPPRQFNSTDRPIHPPPPLNCWPPRATHQLASPPVCYFPNPDPVANPFNLRGSRIVG